jgi:hypothetical protein
MESNYLQSHVVTRGLVPIPGIHMGVLLLRIPCGLPPKATAGRFGLPDGPDWAELGIQFINQFPHWSLLLFRNVISHRGPDRLDWAELGIQSINQFPHWSLTALHNVNSRRGHH